ncbi:MAG TPA: hypothetical protein VMG98_16330 [Verrucomicrobiae bacterium]|nr:hypothetical protein [Verrucomicrobiae bacterium]HTZ54207.1 hypothetical protein [Candidatus Acidoferrum sp.]
MFLSFIISVALLIARAHPSPTPTATPTLPPENPAITAIARREFVSWQAGAVDKNHYVEAAQSQLTPDITDKMSKALVGYGALEHTEWYGTFPIVGAPPGVVGYTYRMVCTNDAIFEQMMIEADGKIDSINFLKKLP